MKINEGKIAGVLVLALALAVGFLPGRVSAASITPGPWNITSANTSPGKCMDVIGGPGATTDGVRIQQWDCLSHQNNQRWVFQPIANSGGYYQVIAVHSNKCLDVVNVDRSDLAELQQWTCLPNATNQQWFIYPQPPGYLLIARHSNKCADVTGGSKDNGARIIQFSCFFDNSHLNQHWGFQAPF